MISKYIIILQHSLPKLGQDLEYVHHYLLMPNFCLGFPHVHPHYLLYRDLDIQCSIYDLEIIQYIWDD